MRKILWWIFIAAMLSVFCYSGWNLYSYWKEENTAGQTFDSITEIYQKAEEQTIPDVPPESPDASPEETVEEEAQAFQKVCLPFTAKIRIVWGGYRSKEPM